ncbi:hypothetical protein MSAN_00537300 [Mycena sanguinolenta]|uniref:SAM domain-containing protein n=1 Tax=Mycena sanguinolenta TaxID=230812 RepID=A0A8H6Z6L6_9AGAR|nr:hypothetical protein MSAN_00537300 [Mycena sanguinolenta]
MNSHRPNLNGGKGGKGGNGGRKGGNGGIGERPQLARDDINLFNEINGGIGGTGGDAVGRNDGEGGDGGAGQGPKISTEPLLPGVDFLNVPDMGIDDFCKTYGVRDRSRTLLKGKGFDMAADILEVSEHDLETFGLQAGEIMELKRTLRKFLAKSKRR